MTLRWLLLFILVTATMNPASASSDTSLSATHVTVNHGTTTGDLELISVLRIDGTSLPPAFLLQADTATIQTDHSDLADRTTGTTTKPTTSETTLRSLQMDGVRNGGEGALFVHPAHEGSSHVTFSASCFDVSPSNLAKEYRTRHVDPSQPAHRADLAHSIRVSPCGALDRLTVTGDFLVGLWDWDADWSSSEDQGRLVTGYHDERLLSSQADEAFIHVQDGRLVLPITDTNLRLFLSRSIIAASDVLLGNIQGQVQPTDGMTFDGDNLILRGDIRLALEPAGIDQPMQVQVLHAPVAAPLGSVAAPIPGSMTLLASSLLVLAGILLALHHRHRRPERALSILWSEHEVDLRLAPRTRRERRALGMQLLGAHHALEGRKGQSQRLQGRATELYKNPIEALMGLGEALLALGAYEHALDAFFVVQETGPTPTQQVRAQVGAAVAHLRRGGRLDQHVCAEYLRDAQSRDPGTVQRLLNQAGDVGNELMQIDRRLPDHSAAMFG